MNIKLIIRNWWQEYIIFHLLQILLLALEIRNNVDLVRIFLVHCSVSFYRYTPQLTQTKTPLYLSHEYESSHMRLKNMHIFSGDLMQ